MTLVTKFMHIYKYFYFILQNMAKTKVTPRMAKEMKVVKQIDCLLCGTEFRNQEELKNHLVLCVEKKATLSCTVCHKTFKKKTYLNKHVKNTHGQDTPKKKGEVKIIEVEIAKDEDVDKGSSSSDSWDEDDFSKYDPGELTEIIGELSHNSADEDVDEASASDEGENNGSAADVRKNNEIVPQEVQVNQSKTDKGSDRNDNDDKEGPCVRKKCNPMPVYAPPKRKADLLKHWRNW